MDVGLLVPSRPTVTIDVLALTLFGTAVNPQWSYERPGLWHVFLKTSYRPYKLAIILRVKRHNQAQNHPKAKILYINMSKA